MASLINIIWIVFCIQVIEIIKEIKNNSKESLASIGRRFNISSRTMSSINCGATYKQDNEKYPIR